MANATEHIRQERELLLTGSDIPRLPGKLAKRPVLVVNRRFRWQEDLGSLKRWIKERDPVMFGVGNGVEALLDAGAKTDVTGPDGLSLPALARKWNKPQVAARLER